MIQLPYTFRAYFLLQVRHLIHALHYVQRHGMVAGSFLQTKLRVREHNFFNLHIRISNLNLFLTELLAKLLLGRRK